MYGFNHPDEALPILAEELEKRAERLLSAMWNSTDFTLQRAVRCAFYGAKPTVVDFLINGGMLLHRYRMELQESKKEPEA